MSFRAMIWAWEVDGLTSSTKLVLLSLAQHSNEDGRNSFPSVATIAEECRMSERTVQGALRALEAEGYITVERRLRKTNLFSLRMDLKVVARRQRHDKANPANSAPFNPADSAGTTPQNFPFNPAESAPEPVLEPVRNEPADAGAREAEDEDCAGAFDRLFGGPLPVTTSPPRMTTPSPVLSTARPPPSPPPSEPIRWMPRLSDPERRWACLATDSEIDPKSMNGGRKHIRSGWFVRDIAAMVADAAGWSDLTRYTDWRPLCAWLDDGIDPHDTILPTIRRIVERRGNVEIATLSYFDKAVREAAAGGSRRRAG